MAGRLQERIGVAGWLLRLFLVTFTVLCILPFYYVLMVALSDPVYVRQGEIVLFPRGFSLAAFEAVLGQRAFPNSFFVLLVRAGRGV